MPALCLMLSSIYYAKNYAGIISWGLTIILHHIVDNDNVATYGNCVNYCMIIMTMPQNIVDNENSVVKDNVAIVMPYHSVDHDNVAMVMSYNDVDNDNVAILS